MKNILLIITSLLTSFLFAQNNPVALIPEPANVMLKGGFFILDNECGISYNSPGTEKSAIILAEKISKITGIKLDTGKNKMKNIFIELNENSNQQIGEEGYNLIVEEKKITIKANTETGIFYGIQTLLQLIPAEAIGSKQQQKSYRIPTIEIIDYPRFPWRGAMLDVSRHFFTKEEVKTHIDQLSHYKFNTLHLHLTDDQGWRIEIKSLPKLTDIGAWRVERHGQFGERENPKPGEPKHYGGFYTHDDIREIVEYAKEKHVTIVPEIDIPGHCMALLAAYPNLSCTKDTSIQVNPGTHFSEWYSDGSFKMLVDNTLNPADENVYKFLDNVFTEIAMLFPGEYIHVGGDECYKGYWSDNTACKILMKELDIKDVSDLQVYFMKRVNDIITSKGKKMIAWGEDGNFPVGSTVMSWKGFQRGIDASTLGLFVVMTPTQHCYLDYQQGELSIEPPVYASLRLKETYHFEPVPENANEKYILGGQANLWTENIPTFSAVQYMMYPRAWAIAEVLWSPKDSRNWETFTQKTENHFIRAEAMGINYSSAIYDPIITVKQQLGKLIVTLESEAQDVEMHYSVDGTMPSVFGDKYKTPIVIPNGNITFRCASYRNGKKIGNLITLTYNDLQKRADQ
jgi:hexosaminidase